MCSGLVRFVRVVLMRIVRKLSEGRSLDGEELVWLSWCVNVVVKLLEEVEGIESLPLVFEDGEEGVGGDVGVDIDDGVLSEVLRELLMVAIVVTDLYLAILEELGKVLELLRSSKRFHG